MRKFFTIVTAISLYSTFAYSISTVKAKEKIPPKYELSKLEYVPGEIIVKFKSNVEIKSSKKQNAKIVTFASSIDILNEKFDVTQIVKVFRAKIKSDQNGTLVINGMKVKAPNLSNIYKIKFDKRVDVLAANEEYKNDPNIEYAEPNYIYSTCGTPNDSLFYQQWALKKIQAEQAWDIETGDTSVVISIIDTGVDWDHPDLANNIWINHGEIPDNGIDDDQNGYVDDFRGWDFVSLPNIFMDPGEDPGPPDNDPMDFFGHGTHCAGIAAATTNNGIGVSGLSWYSKIMSVRVGYKDQCGQGKFSNYDASLGIFYSANNGADIINMSWGGYNFSYTIEDAINYADSLGCILIAAAGDHNLSDNFYPAAYRNVISVSATNENDRKKDHSNYGSWINVSAPGVDIYSTFFDDTYSSKNGTSMSASFVAGLASLIISQHPDWNNNQVIGQIINTADNIDSLNPEYEGLLGTGRINVYRALTTSLNAPMIVYDSFTIEDTSGDNDGEIDRGETVDMVIAIKNLGIDATDVSAYLYTTDPYIDIINNDPNYGNIAFGSVATNYTNPFSFSVDDTYLFGHTIEFELQITSENGAFINTETFYLNINLFTESRQDLGLHSPIDIVLGDIDNDGDLDLVIGDMSDSTVKIYRNDSNGVFIDTGQRLPGEMIWNIALGDIDCDGDLDMVLAKQSVSEQRIFFNDGTGTFIAGQGLKPSGRAMDVALGDVDNDGDLDLIEGSSPAGAGENKVYFNDGKGYFKDSMQRLGSSYTYSVELGDIDSDGDLDFIAGNQSSQPTKVYLNDGRGKFIDSGQDIGTFFESDIILCDIDKDEDLDLILGIKFGCGNKIFLNDGYGKFTDSGQNLGSAFTQKISIGDLDNDGDLDLIAGNGEVSVFSRQQSELWINNGYGIFTKFKQKFDFYSTHSIALGDIDGDGDIDLIEGNGYQQEVEPLKVYLNNAAPYGASNCDTVMVNVLDSSINNLDKLISDAFYLKQNFPNPFNPITTIKYAIPEGESEHVRLNIYDLRGAMVRILVDELRSPGVHSAIWDGTNENGSEVSSGIYIYRLQAGEFSKSNKMLLVR